MTHKEKLIKKLKNIYPLNTLSGEKRKEFEVAILYAFELGSKNPSKELLEEVHAKLHRSLYKRLCHSDLRVATEIIKEFIEKLI